MKKIISIVLFSLFSSLNAFASEQVFRTTEEQVGVLELYTSEGCSSCPPADRWFTKLKGRSDLWNEFVPIAFHVDYWDYIGWKDRFASPDYTDRQRMYAYQKSVKTIYTPGLVYDGHEWRNWRYLVDIDFPEGKKPGVFEINVQEGAVYYKFTPTEQTMTDDMLFNIALLGFEIQTNVERGENAGRKLHHDFVVLDLEKSVMKYKNGSYEGKAKLPDSSIIAPKYGVAAWVNSRHDLSPIQAVGGYLE